MCVCVCVWCVCVVCVCVCVWCVCVCVCVCRRYPGEVDEVYTLPSYFGSDWLNEVWAWREDVCDDYKFVYMGPTGTW